MLLERVHWHTLLLVSDIEGHFTLLSYSTCTCIMVVTVFTLLVYIKLKYIHVVFAVVPGPFVIPTTTTPFPTGALSMIPTGISLII